MSNVAGKYLESIVSKNYSVRRAAWLMTHSRLKLIWIDSRFNPVWKLIPFERALNAMQYMWIWQHSNIQHQRKVCFYIEHCLEETADEYDDMFMSGCDSIVCLCLNRRLNRRLNQRRTSQWYILMALRILQNAQKPKLSELTSSGRLTRLVVSKSLVLSEENVSWLQETQLKASLLCKFILCKF